MAVWMSVDAQEQCGELEARRHFATCLSPFRVSDERGPSCPLFWMHYLSKHIWRVKALGDIVFLSRAKGRTPIIKDLASLSSGFLSCSTTIACVCRGLSVLFVPAMRTGVRRVGAKPADILASPTAVSNVLSWWNWQPAATLQGV